MDIELMPIQWEHESNATPNLSERGNNPDHRNIKPTVHSEPEKWLNMNMKSDKIYGFGFILYVIFLMIIGILIVCLTTHKSSSACVRDFQRKMKSSRTSNSQPRSIAIGDLNNDQKIDIVVSNFGTDTIGVFISNGSGTYEGQYTYSTDKGSQPYSVIINDFNHDNYSDIAVANYGTNNVGIFLGNGSGKFPDQKIFSLGSSRPVFITAGDFNKDNHMDITVVNYGTNDVGILLGYGNGSFHNQMTYPTGYDSFPLSLVAADFNNDSYLDIAVANYGTNNIGIFFGYGNGTFTIQQTYTTLSKSNPSSIAFGDFNNDHKLDIAVANNGSSTIGLFFGYGNGSFHTQTTFSIGFKSYPQYITVGYLNNDSTLDIVVVDSRHNQIHVLPGSGDGNFTLITTYDGIAGSHPFCAAVTDLNTNNQSDIVVVNYDTNDVLVLTDYFTNPSMKQINYNVEALYSVVSVAAGDFNNDQINDVAYMTSGYLHVRFGLGDGSLSSEIKQSTTNTLGVQYIIAGDVNNDTNMDLIAAYIYSGSVSVLLGDGKGNFPREITYSTGNGSRPYWIDLGDVNNDNRLDIVSVNQDAYNIDIFLGNGDGTFNTMIASPAISGLPLYSVALGDLNHDNYLDSVVTSRYGYIVVFGGNGDGTFTIRNLFSIGNNGYCVSIVLGDFNGDTHLDFIVANTVANNIGVFFGSGNGAFGSKTFYSTGPGSSPYYVIAADLNNDNVSDIAVTNYGTDEIISFSGLGNGSFTHHETFSTGIGSKPYGMTVTNFGDNNQSYLVVGLSGSKQIATINQYNAAVFTTQTEYPTGSAPEPYSLAVGDFNNDNQTDIVVANSGTDNLNILIGLGNGTFDMTMEYSIGTNSYPQYVITFDVNKDNKLDLISANSKMDSISVIMGYGNGSFARQLLFPTGSTSYPVFVTNGDLNNDTRADLVVANENTNSIGIFFGYNYAAFQNQKIYSSDDSLRPFAVDISDFNNDKYLDIATTFSSINNIGILLGDGNGSFSTIKTYATGNGSVPSEIAIDDLNNDGQSDIAVANYLGNTVGVFLGYGNGSFTSIKTYSTGESSAPIDVTTGDINNDNQSDIITANSGSNSIGALIGYGNGIFSQVTIYSTGTDTACRSVILGDFNNDANLDIIVANYGTQNIGILFGNGDGTFGNQIILPMTHSSQPVWLALDDLNNDNRLDIVVADLNNDEIGIFLGHGDGTFDIMRSYSAGDGSGPRCVRVGDFNSDNISDIAVANGGTNTIVVLFGFGDGTFLLGTTYTSGTSSLLYALAIGDFNNDTRLDIVVANYGANNIGIFLADDYQPFGSMTKYNLDDGSGPCAIAVNDLDNNGWSDIVVANYGTNNIGILLGYGHGSFNSTVKYFIGNNSAPSFVAVADFNNDTILDIVASNAGTDNIVILFGIGNGAFDNKMTYYSTGSRSYPYALTTGDLNNDNIIDIVVANYGTNIIFLLYGYGNGTFGNETSYPLGYNYNPDAIVLKDLNQDHSLDILVACHDTDHIEIFISACP